MAIAGWLVVPVSEEVRDRLKDRLASTPGLEVQGVGPKGIAVVADAENVRKLRRLSEEVGRWPEVLDVQLGYLNWEDEEQPLVGQAQC